METLVQTKIFATRDFDSIQRACTMSQDHRLMTGIIADTGMGKTTAINEFAANGKNVFTVTVDKTMNAKRFFAVLLGCMGVSFDGSIYEIMQRITETVNALEKPLIIIDEAGKLTHTMILYLHVLRERTKGNAGIVLVGMPYFRLNLEKYSSRQKEGYSEFLRRVNVWHELEGLNHSETEFICRENGIKAGYKAFYNLRFGDLVNKILLDRIINQ